MPSWYDRFGQEWAKSGLTDDPTNAQGDAGWAFIGQAPPTVEQFNSMFQWSDDKDNWLYGQIANVILKGNLTPNSNDLTQLYNAILGLLRKRLSTNLAVYVDAINGNDVTGTGVMGSPWKTIQHALVFLYNFVDPAGYTYTIQLAPGTYESFYHNLPINGQLVVQGDNLNPRAYIIKNNSGTAVTTSQGSVLYLQGISVEAAGVDTDYNPFGVGIFANSGSVVIFDALAFGPCSQYHVWAQIGGGLWPWRGNATVYTIYGGAKAHQFCSLSAAITTIGNKITILNNPNFSSAYLVCTAGGYIQTQNMTYTGTVSNTKKYTVANAGQIITAGQGAGIIPGTIAGDSSNGGIFW